MLIVQVRMDLKMRKGKMSAQVSHAVMAYWLSMMARGEDSFTMPEGNKVEFDKWVESGFPIKIYDLFSEDELLSKETEQSALIVDSGKTEFGGKPTPTCICDSTYNLKVVSGFEGAGDSRFRTKQVLVFNKSNKGSKYEISREAAIASVMSLLPNYSSSDNELVIDLSNEAVKSWLSGAFTKIGVRCNSDILPDVDEKMLSFNFNNLCVAIGPDHAEEIDKYTSEYKLV